MKKLAVALAIALVTFGIFALYLWSQLHTERQQLAALQTNVATLESGPAGATPVPAAGAQPALVDTTSPETPAESAQDGTAPAPARPVARPTGDQIAAGITEMIGNPDMLGAQLRQQFPDAAQELGLSPSEADKFYNLMARQAGDSLGDAFALMGGGDSAATQAAGRRMVEKQQANDKEMAALLGGRIQQWENYQGTMQARQQVTQLRAVLGSGDNALSEEKSKPLIAALGAEAARINTEMKRKMEDDVRASRNVMEEQLKFTSEQNSRLIRAATPHLSSTQLDRYKQMLAQQDALVRALLGGGNKQGASR